MRFLIHLVAESEAGQRVQEIACLERNEPRLENIGLSLREAKQLLAAIQTMIVEQQVAGLPGSSASLCALWQDPRPEKQPYGDVSNFVR